MFSNGTIFKFDETSVATSLFMRKSYHLNTMGSKLSKIIEENSVASDYIICHADIKDFKLNKWTKIENGIEISTGAEISTKIGFS